jgi:glycerophosphoryl diester phosphodiesterase
MEWWAHRGSGKGPEENTLKAFKIAVDSGFKSIEFDVMLTADGVPVIHHDWETGRCATPKPHSKLPQNVSLLDLSLPQLQEYTVKGEPIPTLEQALNFCIQHQLHTNVELKARNPSDARNLGYAVKTLFDKFAQNPQNAHPFKADNFVFSSFYHACLLPLVGYQLALLYEEELPNNWIIHADALQASAIHLDYLNATPDTLRRIHTTGRKVRVYTVNDLDMAMSLASLGVDGLFTDRMEFISE